MSGSIKIQMDKVPLDDELLQQLLSKGPEERGDYTEVDTKYGRMPSLIGEPIVTEEDFQKKLREMVEGGQVSTIIKNVRQKDIEVKGEMKKRV